MVARNGNRIKARHFFRGVLNDIRHYSHRRLGRIDKGVTHHKFFEYVVLYGAAQCCAVNPLLFTGNHKHRKHRQYRAIHSHRNGHLIKRNSIKKYFHVFDGINRHTGLADITNDALMVTVITAVCGQIKRDRQALLPGSQISAVKGIGLFRRGEACVLSNRPRAPGVHSGAYTAGEGITARQRFLLRQRLCVCRGIQRLDGYSLGGSGVECCEVAVF